ncbi:MAG: hypothetical protein K2X81_05135, partial [Candidatus Obscuribacterales bacterium]|nr:hypothetical protein [Candidatus Obscuribacterales bacterium]
LDESVSSIYAQQTPTIIWRPYDIAVKEQRQTHKPLFLFKERMYSTEQLEAKAVAEKLNRDFIPVKIPGEFTSRHAEQSETPELARLARLADELELGEPAAFAIISEGGAAMTCSRRIGSCDILKFLRRSTKKYKLT